MTILGLGRNLMKWDSTSSSSSVAPPRSLAGQRRMRRLCFAIATPAHRFIKMFWQCNWSQVQAHGFHARHRDGLTLHSLLGPGLHRRCRHPGPAAQAICSQHDCMDGPFTHATRWSSQPSPQQPPRQSRVADAGVLFAATSTSTASAAPSRSVSIGQTQQQSYHITARRKDVVLGLLHRGVYRHWYKGKSRVLKQLYPTHRPSIEPWKRRFLGSQVSSSCAKLKKSDSLSTSATLCCRICCSVLGLSSSFCTLAMMLSASSFCWRCLTWLSYRTHESSTLLASAASAVRCSSSYAWASSLAVS